MLEVWAEAYLSCPPKDTNAAAKQAQRTLEIFDVRFRRNFSDNLIVFKGGPLSFHLLHPQMWSLKGRFVAPLRCLSDISSWLWNTHALFCFPRRQ